MKALRPYQIKAQQALDRDLVKTKSVLVEMATGTGKTFTISNYLKRNAKSVLWLTHKEELIDQSGLSLLQSLAPEEFYHDISKLYEKHNNSYIELITTFSESSNLRFWQHDQYGECAAWIHENMGLIKQTQNDYSKKYTVASVQTAQRRLEELAKCHFEYIIVDEAHLALSNSWLKVCQGVKHDKMIGLTATPERMDGIAMNNLFSKISYSYNLHQAVNDKNLCEIDAVRVQTNVNLNNVRTTAGELNQGDLKIVDCDERNLLVCKKYHELANGRKTLVFAVNVAHAVNITKMMHSQGINAKFIVADTALCPNRREIIKSFTHGDLDVLVNVDILTTGFDYPNIGCIMVLRPTKSKNLYIQMIGRGTRLKSNDFVAQYGQNLLVLDFVDVTSKHALINSYTLDYGKRIEDRIFITAEEKEKLITERNKSFGAGFNKVQIDRLTDQDVRVNLLNLPIIDQKMMYNMENAPMTIPQRDFLKSLGYDVENNSYTKAAAFQLIGNQPASYQQLSQLKNWGYDISCGATLYQYKKTASQKAAELTAALDLKKKEKLKTNLHEFYERQKTKQTSSV